MSNLDFTICCIVTFFSKKRGTPPNLNNGKYCPRLVIKGSNQIGVNFIDGEDVIFERPIRTNALPVNEDIDYSALQVGTEFFIIEGSTIVGEGIVKEIFQHKPHGRKQL